MKSLVKCIRCGRRIFYNNMNYAVRIPEMNKYAPVCDNCYKRRKGNALPVKELRRSKYNGKKLERENLLEIP